LILFNTVSSTSLLFSTELLFDWFRTSSWAWYFTK